MLVVNQSVEMCRRVSYGVNVWRFGCSQSAEVSYGINM